MPLANEATHAFLRTEEISLGIATDIQCYVDRVGIKFEERTPSNCCLRNKEISNRTYSWDG